MSFWMAMSDFIKEGVFRDKIHIKKVWYRRWKWNYHKFVTLHEKFPGVKKKSTGIKCNDQ